MNNFLKESYYIDYSHPLIKEKIHEILKGMDIFNSSLLPKKELGVGEKREIAIKLFYFVRDEITYIIRLTDGGKLDLKEYMRKEFKASRTLSKEAGFCIPKAALLCALGRGAGIPTRLHFANILNYRNSESMEKLMGNRFLWHGYVEFQIGGEWIKANPAFDKELCARKEYPVVEFDGVHNAMFPKKDENGNRFIEYIDDKGIYANVPYLRIVISWARTYGWKYIKALFSRKK